MAEEIFQTLVHRLFHRLETEPEREAFRFLSGASEVIDRRDVAQLGLESQRVAHHVLVELGLSRGDRVVLAHPPGLEFVSAFLGCLRAGLIAVPVAGINPFNPGHTAETVIGILRDSGARAVLSVGYHLRWDAFEQLRAEVERRGLGPLSWVATDELDEVAGSRLVELPRPEDIAFLQYTSGSTGQPKGVQVSHGNLMHQINLIGTALGANRESEAVVWVPHYHDMCLIGAVSMGLHGPLRCNLMSPLDFVSDPVSWFEAMSVFGATHTAAPDFAYSLVMRRMTPERLAGLDLSRLRIAMLGAEPIRERTIADMCETFAGVGLKRSSVVNGYGLAEHGLMVLVGSAEPLRVQRDALELEGVAKPSLGELPALQVASAGRPGWGVTLKIVDPDTRQPKADGEVGELWVDSLSKTHGYFNRPELTPELFEARTADPADPHSYLRTGDLGFMHEGEVYVTGRLKDLIIVSGRNLYPQDIEEVVGAAHPAVRKGGVAAFVVGEGAEGVGLLVEIDAVGDMPAVVTAISRRVLEVFQVAPARVVLARRGAVLKTTSGKLQRSGCRLSVQREDEHFAQHLLCDSVGATGLGSGGQPRGHERHGDLAARLREVLAQATELPGVSVHDELTAVGLSSLSLVSFCAKAAQVAGCGVHPADVLASRDLLSLAQLLSARCAQGEDALPDHHRRVLEEGLWPASRIQEATWRDMKLKPSHHITSLALRFEGALEPAHVQAAFTELVARHELLRARFFERDGRLLMEIKDQVPSAIRHICEAPSDDAGLRRLLSDDVGTAFDPAAPPLMRCTLVRLGDDAHLLHIVLQHLVYDAVTVLHLYTELLSLIVLKSGGLPLVRRVPTQRYEAFVRWEAQRLHGPRRAVLDAYWAAQLSGVPLDLPLDGLGGTGLSDGVMHTAAVLVRNQATAAITALARRMGTTPYVVLLSAWFAALSMQLRRDDLVVGSTVSTRTDGAFAEAMGPIVNYLPLRAKLSPSMGFAELVQQMHLRVREGFAHSDLPVVDLIDAHRTATGPLPCLGLSSNFNYYDLTELMGDDLVSRLAAEPQVQLGHLKVSNMPAATLPVSRPYDTIFGVLRTQGQLQGSLRYDPAVMSQRSADELIGLWRALLIQAVESPEITLATALGRVA